MVLHRKIRLTQLWVELSCGKNHSSGLVILNPAIYMQARYVLHYKLTEKEAHLLNVIGKVVENCDIRTDKANLTLALQIQLIK